ncbi:hypothetical protein ACFUN8_35810 [Streptomyces sp. NPDC057307]|uniref:hypothetical protein n=1 Tax=Streptomyces sp. NPDC057307 TaxID=3346096 RepID=UPI0036255A3B
MTDYTDRAAQLLLESDGGLRDEAKHEAGRRTNLETWSHWARSELAFSVSTNDLNEVDWARLREAVRTG